MRYRAIEVLELAGVPALARDIFLDVDPAPGAVLAQLERAAERARELMEHWEHAVRQTVL